MEYSSSTLDLSYYGCRRHLFFLDNSIQGVDDSIQCVGAVINIVDALSEIMSSTPSYPGRRRTNIGHRRFDPSRRRNLLYRQRLNRSRRRPIQRVDAEMQYVDPLKKDRDDSIQVVDAQIRVVDVLTWFRCIDGCTCVVWKGFQCDYRLQSRASSQGLLILGQLLLCDV